MLDPALWRAVLCGSSLMPFVAVSTLRTVFHSRPHNKFRAFLELLAGGQAVIALYFFAMLLAIDLRPDKKWLQLVIAALFWATWILTTLAFKLASEPHIRSRLAALGHSCPVDPSQPCTAEITPAKAARLSWPKLTFFLLSFAIALWVPSWLAAQLQPVPARGPSAIPQPDRYVRLPQDSWSFLTWARSAGTTTYTLALQDLPSLPGHDSIIVEVSSPKLPVRFGTCQPAAGSMVAESQQPFIVQNTPALYRFFLPNFDSRLGWYITLQAYTGARGPATPELGTRIGYVRFR